MAFVCGVWMSPICPFRLSLSLNFIYVESKIPTGVNWVWRCQKNKTASPLWTTPSFVSSLSCSKISQRCYCSVISGFSRKKKRKNKIKQKKLIGPNVATITELFISFNCQNVLCQLLLRLWPHIWVSGEFSSSQILLLCCCTVALWTLQAHFRQR